MDQLSQSISVTIYSQLAVSCKSVHSSMYLTVKMLCSVWTNHGGLVGTNCLSCLGVRDQLDDSDGVNPRLALVPDELPLREGFFLIWGGTRIFEPWAVLAEGRTRCILHVLQVV